VDTLAETEGCRVYSAVQDIPHTGCRGFHLGAASSPSQLISVTAFVYGVFRAYCGDKGLYSEQCSRSESLHVKGFCLEGFDLFSLVVLFPNLFDLVA